MNGTYTNPTVGATLVIANANDSTGTFDGTLALAGVNYNVNGKYHFKNSNAQNGVMIALRAINGDVACLVWTLFSTDYKQFTASGTRADFNGVVSNLGGTFTRI